MMMTMTMMMLLLPLSSMLMSIGDVSNRLGFFVRILLLLLALHAHSCVLSILKSFDGNNQSIDGDNPFSSNGGHHPNYSQKWKEASQTADSGQSLSFRQGRNETPC
jgi:hypothetical protein